MSNETISVIVPVYQVVDYLKRCIESIISQSYRELQIILIDDGSTDGSSELCDYYASVDNRITVIHKENGGLVSARKAGLEIASGKYIAFVDSDDYINENMYEELHEKIFKSDVDFVNSGFICISEDNHKKTVMTSYIEKKIIDENDRQILIENCFFGRKKNEFIAPSIWAKLFKSGFIKDTYRLVPDKQDYGEDVLCLYVCLSKCKSMISVDRVYYNYVLRRGSISNVDRISRLKKEIRLYDCLMDLNDKLLKPMRDDVFVSWIREKLYTIIIDSRELFDNSIPFTEHYYFRDIERLSGKKIIIYGAGNVGRNYFYQINRGDLSKVICMLDSKHEEIKWNKVDIYAPDTIRELEYDVVVIALLDESVALQVKEELIRLGVDSEKIIWERPSC